VATSYALANPDVAVTLEHDGRETFATTGSGALREAVLSVYGREVAESMIPVELDTEDADGAREGDEERTVDSPLTAVSGLVSHPETTRASREYLSTFVNGRYVTAGAVREAVVDAYGGQLAADRYPFAVLFLSVDPASVDVNVHPRKLEVRFADSEGVREQVRDAVETALLDAGLVRSSAPRGRSAPEQTEIRPGSADGAGTDGVDDGQPATESPAGRAESGDGVRAAETATEAGPAESTETTASASDAGETDPGAAVETAQSISTTESGMSENASRSGASPDDNPPRAATTGGSETQVTLGGDEATPRTAYETLPDLRVLGQLDDTYIVAEADDGLVLVDQHAADERVNYERLRERFEGDTTTQALADPVELELTAREAAAFETSGDALARLGFHADRVDDRTVRVSTVPAFVADAAGPALVRDALANLVENERAAERTVEAVADELLADMACHPSITGNTSLTEGSVVDLLSALDGCENPWACPHGRPVLIQFDSEEIENRFERDYPGH